MVSCVTDAGKGGRDALLTSAVATASKRSDSELSTMLTSMTRPMWSMGNLAVACVAVTRGVWGGRLALAFALAPQAAFGTALGVSLGVVLMFAVLPTLGWDVRQSMQALVDANYPLQVARALGLL